jgi:hypothetical protein
LPVGSTCFSMLWEIKMGLFRLSTLASNLHRETSVNPPAARPPGPSSPASA